MDITVFMKQHLENQATIIALLQGQAGGAATTTKTTAAAGKKPAATKKPTVTKSQATAAVKKVQETLGSPAARELLGSCGVAKLAEMTEADYEAVYAAANAALEGGETETEEEDI
ncbi:hypothetical protein JT326_gp70 [Aeromonas phage vB_AhyS-A18P4]|uniref:Uncharacterized protein n=1 Tax=Aeromonas phage vB_AhyS-A18P4 TaxID=2608321 RepID=A0A5J6T2U6_9CAUD|nr:hypothetical protein JT326_gp70 [Aeromonas phage vB_AhyS-A18P4]QFG04473.1 hypothetical protein [Aeromonas phage vB_AhyS-A18P4]